MDIRGTKEKDDVNAAGQPTTPKVYASQCPDARLKNKGNSRDAVSMPVPENSSGPVTVMVAASTKDRRGQASRRFR
jgi:hypothetical protein